MILKVSTQTAFRITAGLFVFCCLLWLALLWHAAHHLLWFDDAYMFYRYALNMRAGLGVSWNLDGVHTYGQTAPLWCLVVLAMSFLPLSASKCLLLASWICGGVAVWAISWAVSRNSLTQWMSRVWHVVPLVALPLVCIPIFFHHETTGMETMLAVGLCGFFAGLVLRLNDGVWTPEQAAGIGLLLFLTRPESAAVVALFSALTVFVLRVGNTQKLARLLGLFSVGVVLDLVFCHFYFGTALPLSFYMKSAQGYVGYGRYWYPGTMLVSFLAACLPYLCLMLLFGRAKDSRLFLCFLIPLACIFAYFSTVTQIMGFSARYYVPYLSLVIIPGLMALDRRMDEQPGTIVMQLASSRRGFGLRWTDAVALCIDLIGPVAAAEGHALDRHMEHLRYAYAPVQLTRVAAVDLPSLPTVEMLRDFADVVLAPLPRGETAAASEVGYLGARAPQVNLIDLAGLNDADLALHGIQPDSILKRKPEIILLPHMDYTFERGQLVTDPEFLTDYDYLAGAGNYGIAVRKSCPDQEQLARNLSSLWAKWYPGRRMSDYMVSKVSWTREKHAIAE